LNSDILYTLYSTVEELKAALKKAQKEAELVKLRAKAYDKMIDLAEERFNIPIRKKSGTKQ
jgi:dsDNA-binding SOS-regulon protein